MRGNLLNLILLWGGLLLVGSGCATGILDSDEEDQPSDCNESEGNKKLMKAKKEVEECVKKCLVILELPENTRIDEKILVKAHRKCANKKHPDKGGSDEQMQELNIARDALGAYIGYIPKVDSKLGTSDTSIDYETLRQDIRIKQIMDFSK